MTNIIQANDRIETLEARLRQRACRPNRLFRRFRPGRAFRRFARACRFEALSRDADIIRAEAAATRKPTWGDL
jgi:hypothetical protein